MGVDLDDLGRGALALGIDNPLAKAMTLAERAALALEKDHQQFAAAAAGVERLERLACDLGAVPDPDERASRFAEVFRDGEWLEQLAVAWLLKDPRGRALGALVELRRLVKGEATRLGREIERRARDLEGQLKEQRQRKEGAQRSAPSARPDDDFNEPDPDVWPLLQMKRARTKGEEPRPAQTPPNLDTILEHDRRYAGRIRWCEFRQRVQLDGNEISDTDETEIVLQVGRAYGLHFGEERVHRSIAALAKRHAFHPVQDYLRGLRWDGVPRLDDWLHDLCGVPRPEDPEEPNVVPAMGRKFMIGSVARAFEPGCQLDTVLVLVGEQGMRKSSVFRTLFGDAWFSDTAIDIRKKDAMESLQGIWCIEWAELDSLRRSEATAVKAFITSRVDRFRPSYGRNVGTFPRQCVLVGTTNEQGFLTDATGSRRFWTVRVASEADVATLAAARDQLWAEACVRYRNSEQWHLTRQEDEIRAGAAAEFEQEDVWTERVLEYCRQRDEVTVKDILDDMKLLPKEQTKREEMRVAAILSAEGWRKRRCSRQGRNTTWWLAP